MIDNYCERVDASFWAEPLNAVTNLSFILAALYCWLISPRARKADWLNITLTINLFAIGVGSFLFHTFATRWAGAADTIPILLFIILYQFSATWRFVGAPLWAALISPLVFIGFAIGFLAAWSAVLPSLNGSQGYFPALILLVTYGLYLGRRGHKAATAMIAAAALFSLSLTFRSIDHAVCEVIPFGTHFMWHTLNGLLLGILLYAFVRHGAPRLAPVAASA